MRTTTWSSRSTSTSCSPAFVPSHDEARWSGPTELEVGDLVLDPAAREVRRGDTAIELSTKEFQLLEVFMRHPGQVLSRYELIEGGWDMEYENRSNVVDVYVRYLREKIDRPFGRDTLETVRGAGYRMRDG